MVRGLQEREERGVTPLASERDLGVGPCDFPSLELSLLALLGLVFTLVLALPVLPRRSNRVKLRGSCCTRHSADSMLQYSWVSGRKLIDLESSDPTLPRSRAPVQRPLSPLLLRVRALSPRLLVFDRALSPPRLLVSPRPLVFERALSPPRLRVFERALSPPRLLVSPRPLR
jgi:hypothetical protein